MSEPDARPAGTRHHGADPGAAEVVCVFVHGRGQSPEDMLEQVVRPLDGHPGLPRVRFVLPRSEGPAWYAVRAPEPLTPDGRAQLDGALAQLGRAVAQAEAECPGRPLVLGGFSQGACLSMEYLMRRGAWAGGAACLLTGCRVGVPGDGPPVARLDGMPVYASGADADPHIPVGHFAEMLRTLAACGARVRADAFPGRPHEVTPTERAALADLLAAAAAKARPFDAAAPASTRAA